MTFGEIKVHVFQSPWNYSTLIMVTQVIDGRLYRAKPVSFEMEPVEDGASSRPATIELPHDFAVPFMQAMAEALDERGIKTDNDATLAGTLKAQTYHLEDLRRMLKLPK